MPKAKERKRIHSTDSLRELILIKRIGAAKESKSELLPQIWVTEETSSCNDSLKFPQDPHNFSKTRRYTWDFSSRENVEKWAARKPAKLAGGHLSKHTKKKKRKRKRKRREKEENLIKAQGSATWTYFEQKRDKITINNRQNVG